MVPPLGTRLPSPVLGRVERWGETSGPFLLHRCSPQGGDAELEAGRREFEAEATQSSEVWVRT